MNHDDFFQDVDDYTKAILKQNENYRKGKAIADSIRSCETKEEVDKIKRDNHYFFQDNPGLFETVKITLRRIERVRREKFNTNLIHLN